MSRKTKATPAGVPRGRSKYTRECRTRQRKLHRDTVNAAMRQLLVSTLQNLIIPVIHYSVESVRGNPDGSMTAIVMRKFEIERTAVDAEPKE